MGRADHLVKHRFRPGQRGGPGRRPGQRNYLTEIALQALGDDFAVHGTAVIEQVRKQEPATYLKIVASLLPRQLQVERSSPLGELTDDELEDVLQYVAASRARIIEQLEGA